MKTNREKCGHYKLVLFFLLLTFPVINSSCSKGYYNREILTSKEAFFGIESRDYIFLKSDTSSYKFNNLVYFERSDSVFIVVAERLNQQECDNLLENQVYELKLKSLRPKNMYNYHYITSYPVFNEEIVHLEKGAGIIWDLYITSNILGVCYQIER